MNIFDILGPVMVGPSSSHTAGAVRIGYVTRTMLGEEPVNAMISLSVHCSDRERTRNRPGAYRRASWYEAG